MSRFQLIDVVRGLAVVAMVVYHAAWFADDRGLVDLALRSLPWHLFQRSIASTFFFLVGVGLVLAHRETTRWWPTLLRLGRIGGGALIVTASSVVLNPKMLVTFGILHSIFTCSVLGLGLLALARGRPGAPRALLALGALCVALPWWPSPAFDGPLAFTGLGTVHVATFDVQPLFPWLGVVCWGMATGLRLGRDGVVARWASDGLVAKAMATIGRHSLLLYMAHVPALVVGVEVLAWWLQG